MRTRISVNSDQCVVAEVRKALAANEGYCPCKLVHTPDTKCMCREFREQVKDPDFEGYCHCMLYYKEK